MSASSGGNANPDGENRPKSRPFNSGGNGARGEGSTQRAPPTCSTCRGVCYTKRTCQMPKVPSFVNDDEQDTKGDESDEELVNKKFPYCE
ncbi:hypothetical protein CCACVL1_03227, partial [Corchorus capsularis]